MVIQEIQEFSEIRTKARAYFCYVLSRAIPNRMPQVSLENVEESIKRIKKDIPMYEAIYILDAIGKQVVKNISPKREYRNKGQG